MSPQRIQLRRTKGWRKPEGAVVVARPSRWGNPFKAMPTADGWSVFYHVRPELDVWLERVGIVSKDQALTECLRLYRLELENWALDEFGDEDDPTGLIEGLSDLRGRDLACWCPLEDSGGRRVACHADVLIELANRAEATDHGLSTSCEDLCMKRCVGACGVLPL